MKIFSYPLMFIFLIISLMYIQVDYILIS
jgi:hypothetical protein